MNAKLQRLVRAVNELDAAMKDYEADLYSHVNANSTRRANAFAETRARVQKLVNAVIQVEPPEPETQAAKVEIEQSTPVQNVARKGRR